METDSKTAGRIARFDGTCKKDGCRYGGRVQKGISEIKWRRGVRGFYWHVECDDLPFVEEVAPAPVAAGHSADSLAAMIAAAVQPLLDDQHIEIEMDEDRVREIAREEAAAVAPRSVVVEYRKPGEAPKVSGLAHKSLPRLVELVQAGFNVMLWGPAGSGKSTAAHQAADLLSIGFDHVELSPMSPDYLLFGAGPLPSMNGGDPIYTRPGFVQAYAGDNGDCLYLIDEVFNGAPALLTKLNTALANGSASYAGGTVKRHPGFRFIACDNTAGFGPSPLHPDRRTPDIATLTRFVRLHWEIDAALEMAAALAFNPAASGWVEWVQGARKHAEPISAKLAALCSPRASIEGAKLLRMGWKPADCAEALIASGFEPASISRLYDVAGKPAA